MQPGAFSGDFYLRPVFYVACAVLIFFIFFGRKLVAAITGMLDSRIEAVKTELAAAAELRAEAERMLADARQQRAGAIEQAQSLLAHAQAEAARLAISMAEEAERSAQRRERMALDRIAAAETAVLTELRLAAVDVATGATQHVLATELTLEDDDILIDRAIAKLPTALRAA